MLGEKIREIRKEKNMTIKDLADKIGVTSGYISQIERNITEPSLTILRKISAALDVPIYGFVSEPSVDTFFIPANARQKLNFTDCGIQYEFLTPLARLNKISPKVEVIHVTMEPQSWGSTEMTQHLADECFYVTKGTIEVHFPSKKYVLNEGDSIYFIENIPHRLYNPTNEKANGLSIMSPAIY